MRMTDGWIAFEDPNGGAPLFWYRAEGENALLRRQDGFIGRIAFAYFREIFQCVDTPCFICRKGIIELIDLNDICHPKLVCSTCEALYCVCVGELYVVDFQVALKNARRLGVAIPFTRVRCGRP